MSLFDGMRESIEDLLNGRTTPESRAAHVHQMKQALVYARLAIQDMQTGVAQTTQRLERERHEVATVRRRRELAVGISDQETVDIALRFEAQHTERIAVLEAKLAAQQAEADLAERELAEMTTQLKAAAAGVGDRPAPSAPSDADLGLPDDRGLKSELNELRRTADRAAKEREADDKLAELKKKLGL